MSFWVMTLASMVQSMFLFFFVMGVVLWGCAEGNSVRRQKPFQENMLGILFLGGLLGGILSLGMLTYGYWWGEGNHYYYFMLPPWGFALLWFSYYNYCVKVTKEVTSVNPERWQRQWREILGLTTEEQKDFYHDYALHNALWAASEDKQAACFAVLPYGEVIYERVQQLNQFESDPSTISDEALLFKLDQQEAGILHVLERYHGSKGGIEFTQEVSECPLRKVYRGTRKTLEPLHNDSADLMLYFQDDLRSIILKYAGEEGEDVFLFVRTILSDREDVYRTAIEWVLWGIVADQFEYDPYFPALALERLGATPLWQANGGRVVLVYDHSVDDEEDDWDEEYDVDDDVVCHTRV